MTLREKVNILSTITTRDDTGKHFTQKYSQDILSELEENNYVIINKPVHRTGIPYSCEYWSITISDVGQEIVETYPEYWG